MQPIKEWSNTKYFVLAFMIPIIVSAILISPAIIGVYRNYQQVQFLKARGDDRFKKRNEVIDSIDKRVTALEQNHGR